MSELAAEQLTLPTFEPQELAITAARFMQASAVLLQTQSLDVQSTFSARGDAQGISLAYTPRNQAQDVMALNLGKPCPRIHFEPVNDNGLAPSQLDFYVETSHKADSGVSERERLAVDEDGQVKLVREVMHEWGEDYEEQESSDASLKVVDDKLSFLAGDIDDKYLGDFDPSERTYLGETLVIPDPLLVPLLGKAAVTAAGLTLQPGSGLLHKDHVELFCSPSRLYGKIGGYGREPSNQVHIVGGNKNSARWAEFTLTALPLSGTDRSFASASLILQDRSSAPTSVIKDTVRQYGPRLRRARIALEGNQQKRVGNWPASLDTIAKMAETAAEIIRGE